MEKVISTLDGFKTDSNSDSGLMVINLALVRYEADTSFGHYFHASWQWLLEVGFLVFDSSGHNLTDEHRQVEGKCQAQWSPSAELRPRINGYQWAVTTWLFLCPQSSLALISFL